MALADRDSGQSMRLRTRNGELDRLIDQPQPLQVVAVPDGADAVVFDDLRVAADGHSAFLDVGQVERRHRQAVRAATYGVGEHQQAGDGLRLVFVHTADFKQRLGEVFELRYRKIEHPGVAGWRFIGCLRPGCRRAAARWPSVCGPEL